MLSVTVFDPDRLGLLESVGGSTAAPDLPRSLTCTLLISRDRSHAFSKSPRPDDWTAPGLRQAATVLPGPGLCSRIYVQTTLSPRRRTRCGDCGKRIAVASAQSPVGYDSEQCRRAHTRAMTFGESQNDTEGPEAEPAPRRCALDAGDRPLVRISRCLVPCLKRGRTEPHRLYADRPRCSLIRPLCSHFSSARQRDTVASHARGRWFEPSRAHPGLPGSNSQLASLLQYLHAPDHAQDELE
jgi:hypothetical protein